MPMVLDENSVGCPAAATPTGTNPSKTRVKMYSLRSMQGQIVEMTISLISASELR